MEVFAEWQPAYAEAGIATFPVDGVHKRPVVKNPLRGRARASSAWARKFVDADAFGIACGRQNRLTILDVDTPHENVLASALDKLGPSPAIAQTASGKFHAYYRFDGERRSIRKAAAALGLGDDIDILGEGGFVIAPPSVGATGSYRFIQGSLADLENLPTMRGLVAEPANDEVVGAPEPRTGSRNVELWRACMAAARDCRSEAALVAFAHELNASSHGLPLGADEVTRTAKSAWDYEARGCNGIAGDRFVQIGKDAHNILKANPDAAYVYQLLTAEHWGRPFHIANGWAQVLPLSLARLQSARKFLLDKGLIEVVRRERKGQAALFRFSRPFSPPVGTEGRRV